MDATGYPVTFEIQRAEAQNRLLNLPLGIGTVIRSLLLIPHLIILYFLGIIATILYVIASVAILFTGVYPAGMHDFITKYVRWNARTNAYLFSLFDQYPPFSGDEDSGSPLRFTAPYPATSSRLLNFPLLGVLIKSLLLIPHFIIVAFLGVALTIVIFIAHFAILFTGSFPVGLHAFAVGVSRWSTRMTAYLLGLTDAYPPFSMN